MPIRSRNIDQKAESTKRYAQITLGDVTATTRFLAFIAPHACVVEQVDFYTRQAVLGGSSVAVTITAQLPANSASLQTRGTSATAANLSASDELSANARYRLTPSANNSLTAGAPLEFVFGITGTGVLSAVSCLVTYVPTLHRESR